MTTTPDDNDPRYEAFMGAFGPNAAPEGQEEATEDLGPTPEDFGASVPWEAQESNSEARLIGRRSGDMLREFLANGFTRQEAIMYIAQMLPHHPH
ncbi:hypothetical protein SEA_BIGMACK_40 [Arthrobacter phage BigMack]|uniref:Uncharacterized protein n=1 Tax=Arthrobacter phage BigMack TaxID=2488953 RepID=A0A3G8FUK7_9CAUD|nr:hypothetical protein KDI95_gp40 [Arthrobacter phage BigMack]AZF98441.1 hypothetical protein SEA_BIGMACK_40 [Arthrobacter phage BigMack]